MTCLNSSGTTHGLMQCPVRGDTPYFTSVQFWMLRRALQARRQGQKTFPPKYWKQLYTSGIREGPKLRMAKSTETVKQVKPDVKKRNLPQLGSYMTKTFLGQGLRQMVEQSTQSMSKNTSSSVKPLASCVLGLHPPHSVVNVDASRHEWLSLLHRNMSDKEAHEAVMNKSWFQKVSEHDAPRLQQRMVSSRPLFMTIPAWASKKLQGEAALWSNKKDIGTGLSAPRLLKRRASIVCMKTLRLPWRASRPSWLKRRRRRSKLLQRVSSRCHGTCLRLTVFHLRLPKHCANTMKRSMHVWWPTARMMRRTLKTTRRVAMQTSSDIAFVSGSLHRFCLTCLGRKQLSPFTCKRMHARVR